MYIMNLPNFIVLKWVTYSKPTYIMRRPDVPYLTSSHVKINNVYTTSNAIFFTHVLSCRRFGLSVTLIKSIIMTFRHDCNDIDDALYNKNVIYWLIINSS